MRLISLFKLATLAASCSTAAEAAAAASAAAAVAASPAVIEAQTGATTPEAAGVMLSTLPKIDSAPGVRPGVPLRDGALQRQQRQAAIAAAVAAFVSASAVIFLVMRCSQFLVPPKTSEINRRALASGGSSGSSGAGGAASTEDTSLAAAGSCKPLMSFPTLSPKELESVVSLQMQQLSLSTEDASELSPAEAEQVAAAQRVLQELRNIVLALGNLVGGFEQSLQEDARELRIMIGELQPGAPMNAAVLQLQADIRADRARLTKWKWQLKEMQDQLYSASHSASQANRCKGLLAARFFKRFSVSSAAAAALAAAQTVLNSTSFGGRSSSSSRSNSGSRSSGSKSTKSSSIRRTFSSRDGDKKPEALDEARGRHRLRKGAADREQLIRELQLINEQQQLATQLQEKQILADLKAQVLQGMMLLSQQRQQNQERHMALQEQSLLHHQPRRNGRRGRGVAKGLQHIATQDDSGQTGANSSDRRGRNRRRQNKMSLKMPLSYIAEEASEEDEETDEQHNSSQLSSADFGEPDTEDERTACR